MRDDTTIWNMEEDDVEFRFSLSSDLDNYGEISFRDKKTGEAWSMELEAGELAELAIAIQCFCKIKAN